MKNVTFDTSLQALLHELFDFVALNVLGCSTIEVGLPMFKIQYTAFDTKMLLLRQLFSAIICEWPSGQMFLLLIKTNVSSVIMNVSCENFLTFCVQYFVNSSC